MSIIKWKRRKNRERAERKQREWENELKSTAYFMRCICKLHFSSERLGELLKKLKSEG